MNTDLVAALRRQFKNLRVLYLVYLIAAVLALVVFFIDKRITFAILAVSVIYHFALVRPKSKGYEKAFNHAAIALTLDAHLKNAVHTAEPILNPEELRRVRLMADNGAKGSILCREGGRGTSGGHEVLLGDATFAHSFPVGDKTHHDFVTGCWITVRLDHDTGLDWRMVNRKAMLKESRTAMLRKMPDLELLQEDVPAWAEEDYVVIRKGDTPDAPSPQFLAALRKLSEHTKSYLAVCVQGDEFHAYLTNRVLAQKVSAREIPQEEALKQDRLPELPYVLRCAEAL